MEPICLDRRNTAYLGMAGAILFSIMWLMAIYADGSWVLGAETLSDLGHPSRDGHPMFNAAAVIAGVLLSFFALGMYQNHQSYLFGRVAMLVALVASLFLIGVGIFPIHVTPYHTIVSYAFFGLMIVALSLWTVHDYLRGGQAQYFAGFTAVLLAISLAFLALTEIGMAEAVAVVCIMIWAVVQGIRMLKLEEA
ncbi:MAG: DUF998 domain-containing protein [Candidatus Methanomethylophilaceae archaeon]|jgi:hypothetical membrane protein|nr:DUF998 domain-containing protein [Candidatus Methanomethylophilaceae archaeon]